MSQSYLWVRTLTLAASCYLLVFASVSAAEGKLDTCLNGPSVGIYQKRVISTGQSDQQTQFFVVGSIHFGDEKTLDLMRDWYLRCAGSFDLLLTETDQVAVGAPELQADEPWFTETVRAMSMDDRHDLQILISTLGLGVDALGSLDPAIAANAISMLYFKRAFPELFAGQIDSVFLSGEKGLKTQALESASAQIRILTDLPTAIKIKLFRQSVSLEVLKQSATELRALWDAWRAGQSPVMRGIAEQGCRRTSEAVLVCARLFGDRTNKLGYAVGERARGLSRVLVVVGAYHATSTRFWDGVSLGLRSRQTAP